MVMVAGLYKYVKYHCTVYLKLVHFIVCKLHLNKTVNHPLIPPNVQNLVYWTIPKQAAGSFPGGIEQPELNQGPHNLISHDSCSHPTTGIPPTEPFHSSGGREVQLWAS